MAKIPGFSNLRRLVGASFVRNIVVVMSGTAIAQLVSFAFSPILSRLYSPADFGIFGTYLSIATVIAAGATLNYSDTVMLPKKDEEAGALLVLSCLATVGVAAGTAIFCLVVSGPWLKLVGMADLGWFRWFVPATVLLLGLSQSLSSWATRQKAFKTTSQAQIVRSSVNCASQTVGGLAGLGGIGLIGSGVIAEAATTLFLGRSALARSFPLFRHGAAWRTLRRKAHEFREFAIYGAPQNVMNALSQGVPVLALDHYFGVAVAGYYAFGMRLLQVPLNFFLTSIRQVLFQKLSQLRADGGDLYGPFLKATGGLALISVGPTCAGFFLAPTVFAFVFGEQWRPAGEFGRWLIVWLAPAFCNVPSALAARILRLQRNLFLYDLALLVARVLALILGGIYFSAIHTVIVLSVVGCLFNLFLIFYVAMRLRAIHTKLAQCSPDSHTTGVSNEAP